MTNSQTARKSAAAGEVAAIGGYWNQYEYSACRLFRLMQNGDLEAITIAEPAAGIFDDLLIHSGRDVHATQVKSARDAEYVALLAALTADQLIAKMAAAWIGLEERYGAGKIRLKYIFAGLFSTSDKSLANAGTSGARHSAEFARFVSRRDLTEEIIAHSIWSAKLQELQKTSGLDAARFRRFLTDLELCDRTELERNRIANFLPDDRAKLEALRDLFPVLVAQAATKRTWSESELIEKLGWRSRLSQFNVHEFPVPPDYQDNLATETRLLDALGRTSGGYVTLCGPPGTGKSTLLQHAIHSTADYSVSRYLAFHPDQRHGLGRAEAGEFLNDLIAELKSQGFYGSRFARDDLGGLRSELMKQLEQAGRRFRETGRKTVVVIDGLDHVPREENPNFSFLKELPAANSVPDGVVFVLGTQRLDLTDLHSTIVQQTNEDGRRIVIDPLSPSGVFHMANAAGVPAFVQREELFKACQGHPLTARYFIEALRNVSSDEDAEAILSHSYGLGRTLEQIYERVWAKLGTTNASQFALGILARAEADLAPEQLAAASSDSAVDDVLQQAGFLLSRGDGGRIAIFHNSFRLFAAAETGKRFGKPDPESEKNFNKKLAEIAAEAAPDDPQHWMELRYCARAGDDAAVLRIGTPSYFRGSLATFRPPSEINTDLRLTYAALRPTRDRVALLNKLLISKEIEYRHEAVSDLDLVGLFLDLGDIELARKHALESGSAGDGWLRLVDHLWAAGEHEAARQVFDANEPLEVLFGGEGLDRQMNFNEARGWIQRAQRFRPIERLAALIDSMSVKTRHFRDDDGTFERKDLKFRLALGVVVDHPETTIDTLRDALALSPEDVACLLIQAAAGSLENHDSDAALTRLGELAAMPAMEALHASWWREAAFIARDLRATDLTSAFVAKLTIPQLEDDLTGREDDSVDTRCRAIYETEFLRGLTGASLAEEAASERGGRSVLLTNAYRKVRELGALRASAMATDPTPGVTALKRIILFFANAQPDSGDFHGHQFFPMLGWLPAAVLRIAFELGGEAVRDIVAFVDELIAAGDNNLARSSPFRLKFASLVFDRDGDGAAAKRRIDQCQADAFAGRTPQEAVSSRADVARALNSVGLKEDARTCLRAMHQDTFGYWLRAKKEPQYQFWAWLFVKACSASPAHVSSNAETFARFILGMDETQGDETAMRLIPDLMQGAGAAPCMAAGITARLINSDLTSWARLADSVLASIATHDPCQAVSALLAFGRLVVPFFDKRLDRCIPACLKALGSADRSDAVARLVTDVERWCPPSQRSALLEFIIIAAPEASGQVSAALERANTVGTLLSRAAHGDSRSSSDQGISLEIDATSYDALIAHGQGRSDRGDGIDYSYGRAAERLAADASKEDIERFVAERPHMVGDARVMIAMGRRLLMLGARALALSFFEKAEKAAFAGQWSSYLGGEKLGLQKLRIDLHGDAGREKGMDVLLSELATGQTFGPTLFLNLDVVLELVTVDLPLQAFWTETENHLKQYREYKLAGPVLPQDGVDSHADLLAFLVSKAFGFSCPEILRHGRAAAALIARHYDGEGFFSKLISLLRQQTGGDREAATLMFRLRAVPHLREALLSHAIDMASHGDFVVANLARRILTNLGLLMDNAASKPLPAFYHLMTADSDRALDFEPPPGIASGQRPVWSDDPWTWTAFLRFPFTVLADHCDFSLDLLRRRCADFMRKEGGRSAFGPEVEKAILSQLRRMSLEFSYRRPMPMAAVRAFGQILQELATANAVDPRVFPMVWDQIGGPSLSGFRIDEEPRTEWTMIPDLPRRQHGGIEPDAWLAATEESLFSPVIAGHFVLAEESVAKIRVWRERAECSRLILPAGLNLDNEIEKLPRLISLDALRPLYDESGSRLICHVRSDLFGDLNESAMTICPFTARALGWLRSRTNPFELADSGGAIVARTVLWVDGTDAVGWHDTELYGRGQAVLLTDSGRLQIEAEYGQISCGVKATRRVIREGGEIRDRTIVAAG